MSLADDLKSEVKKIFKDQWTTRDGQVVPDPADLKLGNDTIRFERATVLYADLSGSTDLVDSKKWWFAAEIYKTYLHCAAKVIKNEGGVITAYDGDRVMAIFLGNSQTNNAANCALKINYAVQKILNPALKEQYPDSKYVVKQTVGIDTSEIHAARTGVRGDNDIVWVGRAANYAAKMTEIKQAENSWITKAAYEMLNENQRIGGEPKQNMWKQFSWDEHNNETIYGSTWWRSI